MRAIMVMFDSLRRDHLPPYGAEDVIAPNFARLADKTVTFDNCYAGSLPCMPARRELHTGRLNFLHRSWGPIEPFDISMPEILKRSGVHTHLISDHLHYWEDGGATYHQRYSTWEIIRGQEADHWIPEVDPELPPEHYGRYFVRDYVNRKYMATEAAQPQTRTFDAGLRFLELNRDKDNWFLQIETFDPHEPYYSMQHYKDLYPHTYEDKHFDWPDYTPVCEGEAARKHLRLEYKALLSMCDHNLGRVLDWMDAHDMWKDAMLIVNTDHGFMLSEHDWWGKCVMPYYDEVAHIPLFVWDPRCSVNGERREELVQTIDLCPTLLSFFDREIPPQVQGFDLGPVIENQETIRDAALFGQHGAQVNVTDGRYVYMRACTTPDNGPLYEYTLMPAHAGSLFSCGELETARLHPGFTFTKGCPVLQVESGSKKQHQAYATFTPEEIRKTGGPYAEVYMTALYDLLEDPKQEKPLHNKEIEEKMCRLMVRCMMENEAPREQYQRLGLTELHEAMERAMQ